ncbi:MAG TPA: glycosyltransferase family 2 protein [Xanthobacteraceae bacterium]|nr:glycosyltransferase family 2 protein [Xanthobacteraceae bacterium]
MSRVALGIPVYNGEAYLAEAVESILGQSCGDFELLISDNASTDGTEEICRRYARQDGRVRYVRQASNIGAVRNFNWLIEHSGDTEFFKWAAHDDVLAPGFLAACVTALDADPSVVLAMPATVLVDEDGSPLPFSPERGGMIDASGMCWPAMPERNSDVASSDAVARFVAIVMHTNMNVENFGVIRRSALKRIAPLGNFLASDKIFLAELTQQGRFWQGHEPLFLRRCHSRQFSVAAMADDRGAERANLPAAYYADRRAEWFFGRPARALAILQSVSVQKLIFLGAYGRVLVQSRLTLWQRVACLRALARRAALRGKASLGGEIGELGGLYPTGERTT